ncbi:MAG: hypothetical protein M1829_000607 [Trizodia sp. TS-e1964]|nr:MAG: hypothetical protein M1829_000607 [Trizodia sp. TS-e1964]
MSIPPAPRRQRSRQAYGHNNGGSTLGHWVPLALTLTAATIGLAAWIWSERRANKPDDPPKEQRDNSPPPGHDGPKAYGEHDQGGEDASASMMARMSGALRRTPSPQQLIEGASKSVVAGMAAAGAAVGGVLSSIREEDRDDFADHDRWSQEAEARSGAGGKVSRAEAGSQSAVGEGSKGSVTGTQRAKPDAPRPSPSAELPTKPTTRNRTGVRRRTVAFVLSAAHGSEMQEHHHHEQASILSHLPLELDLGLARIFVLIYAPDLKLAPTPPQRPAVSMNSSYSNIGHEDAQTPGYTPADELERPLATLEPNPIPSPPSGSTLDRGLAYYQSISPAFNSIYTEAQRLVDHETMIIPYTSESGHVHLLRHLAPEIVYIQEGLCGSDGEVVTHISDWVGQVIVVVGADGGHGGLVDSEDEEGTLDNKQDIWWHRGDRVGLGKGVEVVEGLRLGEDWDRRVGGRE